MNRAFPLLLALVPLAASAVVDTTSTVDPGTPDAAWSWVGAMGGASAVAVGPRAVLTARHVLAGDFVLGGRSYRMASTVEAPKVGTTVDLRVVQLSETLPGWYELGASAAKRSAVTMVGFGGAGVVKASGAGYSLLGGGSRRAGGNVISDRKSWKDRGPVLTSMLDGAGEAVLASGDSGGGWFGADGRLVGISGFVFTKNDRKANFGWARKAYFGSGAVDVTNARLRSWITAQAATGRAFGGPQAVPEPGTWAVLGLGAAFVVRRRRKS